MAREDSTGTLWATWTSGDKVWVNRTQGADTVWGTPYVLATGLDPDDVSAIVAFGGSHVGVMWSDQRRDRFVFAIHDDVPGIRLRIRYVFDLHNFRSAKLPHSNCFHR